MNNEIINLMRKYGYNYFTGNINNDGTIHYDFSTGYNGRGESYDISEINGIYNIIFNRREMKNLTMIECLTIIKDNEKGN